MNNRISLTLGSVLLALLFSSCDHHESDEVEKHHSKHQHEQMPSAHPLSGQSIYQLESSWINQLGETIMLESFAGKVVVLAMVYTHCDNACPRIIADMRLIRKELDSNLERISFVLVSIDPERDTVERLKAFGEETGLTKQDWMLLRGDSMDVRELAAVFGVLYRKTSETDYAHSNIISVLNPQGEILHQQEGLGVRFDTTVATIKTLLSK